MQDTNLREITQPIGPTPRRRGLLIGTIVILGLAVAGGIWFLANRDSATGETASAPTTTTAAAQAAAPTTVAPPATEPPVAAWPPTLDMSAIAFDEESGLVVLFGGTTDLDSGLNDTWAFDPVAETWQERDPETKPMVRFGAAAAYDPGLDRVVVFGGSADLRWTHDDLWLYDVDDDVWGRFDVHGPRPPARTYFDMTYIDSLGGMLIYGGSADAWIDGKLMWSDTWFLDTTTMTWTEVDSEGPGARKFVNLAYDRQSDLVVLTSRAGAPGEPTWIFDPKTMTWSRGRPTPTLGPLELAYDPVGDRVVAPGFAYDTRSDTWSEIPWEADLYGELIVDANGGLLIFGGDALTSYDLGAGTWRLIGPDTD